MSIGDSIMPIATIGLARRRSKTVIALKDGIPVNGQQFSHAVAVSATFLAQYPEKRWALYCADSYNFLVTFLGLLHAGKTVIILPNVQPGFIQAILVHFEAVICDQVLNTLTKPQILLSEIQHSIDAISDQQLCLPPLDPKLTQIELFTSGSTGEPKRIKKTLAQFEQEINTLEATWGLQIGNAIVLATVSHQHIYGLLFRVLWPVMTGRCFDSGLYQYHEQIFAKVEQCACAILISSPAHLTRIPEQIDISAASRHLAAVFSSGGPLNNASAVKLQKSLGFGVIEVFGSSETGGVAHRTQTETETETAQATPWTPLAKVEISIEPQQQCLMVRSPYIGSDDWYLMSDTVEFNAVGQFYLRGRADKIVKIEEKRISLIEIETKLLNSDLVKETATTVLHGPRQIIAVVAVLTNNGQQLLANQGRKVVNETLKKHLSDYFERVVLPRKWRYVDSLPFNSQGKLTTTALQQLFIKEAKKHEKPDIVTEPEYKIVERDAKRIILKLTIPENLHYFKGHFDTKPILPGVVQIAWVMAYSRQYLSVPSEMQNMEIIKFNQIIEPGAAVVLTLQFNADKSKLRFDYTSELGKLSSGRISFGQL